MESFYEQDERLARAWYSLEGLSVGDAFGERPDEATDRLTALAITGPGEREVRSAIDEGMGSLSHVRQKDANLAVLNLSGDPAVLNLDAG